MDEQTTEPSPARPRPYLKSLGSAAAYPVAADATGRLADGYGVADQPWFALISASGKILWKHDGWLGGGAGGRRPPGLSRGRTRLARLARRV